MFDLQAVWELLRIEPGTGVLQSFFLLMIWWTSLGIRKDLREYQKSTDSRLDSHEKRLNDYEGRLVKLER